MKSVINRKFGILPVALVCLLAPKAALSQDMVQVAPAMCKVLLENDRVRVIEVVVKPGETVPMHAHPANLLYTLSTAKMKHTYPDGKSDEREVPAGAAVWSEPVAHASLNTGTTDIRVLVIEMKEPLKKLKKVEKK